MMWSDMTLAAMRTSDGKTASTTAGLFLAPGAA
jgi:hypothetical protein